jgi:hypothetical protein
LNVTQQQTNNTKLEVVSVKESEYSEPIIMFTGVNGTLYHNIISRLGGTVELEDISKVTHLITAAPFRRTIKILCGMSVCPFILTSDWLSACDAADILVDEKNFIIQDPSVDIEQSLKRAQEKKIFDGMTFYATPYVVSFI